MEKFTHHTGVGVPLRRSNVDTDQIIPAEYLKRVTRTGFEDGLFAAWRNDPSFVLNDEAYAAGSVLVAGPDAASSDLDGLRASGKQVLLYEDVLADQPTSFDWPEIDEHDAAARCYTSGTTGNPKGEVYSHRSAWLHSLSACTGAVAGLNFHDRVLPIVPMFHANAWGLAYAALMSGASLCMPDRWLQAEPLVRFIQESRPTVSGAVPTVWNDVLGYLDSHEGVKLDSLRLILCGGSAVPVSLQQALQERHGLLVRQACHFDSASVQTRCSRAYGSYPADPLHRH